MALALQFGAIVAGRLVQTDFVQVEPTRFTLSVPDYDAFNHIAIFVFGAPFPDGLAASVHVNVPDISAPTDWRPLGYLSNDKPSAIFKTNGRAANSGCASPPKYAIIGLAIEPQDAVMALHALPATATTTALTVSAAPGIGALSASDRRSLVTRVAQNIARNVYRYATSFVSGAGTNDAIPLAVFQDWYSALERKIAIDPDMFLKPDNEL